MRWQNAARLAIAAFVIIFAAIVVVALWRRPTTDKAPATTPRKAEGTVAETHGGGEYRSTDPTGKLKYEITFDGQLTYPDGRNVLTNAAITLPDRSGRTVSIHGKEVEVNSGPQGFADLLNARITNGVRLTTSDGLEVTSDRATYDKKAGLLTVPGEVQFKRGRLSGSGLGATYDETRDVLWLLERARMVVAPDEKGGGAVDATAGSAGLARADHYVRLSRNAHVVGDGRTLDADELTVQFTPDDRLIQNMALRGNSRITGAAGGGAEGMSARDIDLTYAADGRTLQHAKLMENAVAQLSGDAGNSARQIAARLIDIGMAPDGATVTSLTATQDVQVDIPASTDAPARRINAASLNAGGPNGLQTATFGGGVTFRETRAAAPGVAAGERTGRSQRLVVETMPGLGAIQQADFRGNVHIEDGATLADGPRIVYKVADDSFDIAPSAGDPGPPPSVNDGRVLVNARTIRFTIASKKLWAETDVRSSLQPSKKGPAPAARGKAGATTSQGGQVPTMLKQDQPVIVTSNRLEYDGAGGVATYTGDARLVQEQTSILADTIVIDDKTSNLNARGRVRTAMSFEEVDSKTKARQLVQMNATGDTMVYEDARRLVTYRTGPTAPAHIVGTQGDVTADVIKLFLKKEVNELERAEADGKVTVKEGQRTGTGDHLTYTTADETYILDGMPVEIEERTPTTCRVTVASSVRFQRSTVSTFVGNNGVTPAMTKPCPPR